MVNLKRLFVFLLVISSIVLIISLLGIQLIGNHQLSINDADALLAFKEQTKDAVLIGVFMSLVSTIGFYVSSQMIAAIHRVKRES